MTVLNTVNYSVKKLPIGKRAYAILYGPPSLSCPMPQTIFAVVTDFRGTSNKFPDRVFMALEHYTPQAIAQIAGYVEEITSDTFQGDVYDMIDMGRLVYKAEIYEPAELIGLKDYSMVLRHVRDETGKYDNPYAGLAKAASMDGLHGAAMLEMARERFIWVPSMLVSLLFGIDPDGYL